MATTFPTLFGRATVVHGEHHELAGTAKRLRALCSAMPDDGTPVDREAALLFANFSVQVSLHFASEESAEYFGTVVTECPWLTDGVKALRLDHQHLTAMLRKLESLADAQRAREEFSSCLVELMDRLGAHEKREHLLLQDFFTKG